MKQLFTFGGAEPAYTALPLLLPIANVLLVYLALFAAALVGLAGVRYALARNTQRTPPIDPSPSTPPSAGAKLQLERLYRLGLEALHANLLDQAARTLELAARRGHTRAQLHFGVLCEHGIGLAADRERAAHWYQQAASQGNIDAHFRLQIMQAATQPPGRCKVRAFSATIAADDPLFASRVSRPQGY